MPHLCCSKFNVFYKNGMSSLKPVLFMCLCDSIGQNKQMRQWKQEKLKKRLQGFVSLPHVGSL